MDKEAEEVLASTRESTRGILARAHHEAMEIVSEARQRIPSTVGPPNPALAREEAKRAAQHLLDQARTNANGLLANAQQRLEEVEDHEALLHACEESTDSRGEGLSSPFEKQRPATVSGSCASKRSSSTPSKTGSTGSERPSRAGRRW
jgi:hypothetical protein